MLSSEPCGLLCAPRAVDQCRLCSGVTRLDRAVAELRGTKKNVLQRESRAEVRAAPPGGSQRMMRAVKLWRDKNAAAEPSSGTEQRCPGGESHAPRYPNLIRAASNEPCCGIQRDTALEIETGRSQQGIALRG